MVCLGVDIADNGDDGIVGCVVTVEELFGLGAGQILDIRHPADGRLAVGVGQEAGGHKGFPELALRVGIVGAAPLLHHHRPFGVEFAQHRILHAVRLDGGPQFQLVGGQADQIGGAVAAGKGVVAGAAVLGIQLEKLILYDIF